LRKTWPEQKENKNGQEKINRDRRGSSFGSSGSFHTNRFQSFNLWKPGRKNGKQIRGKKIMLAAIFSFISWLFGGGGLNSLLDLFKKNPSVEMKKDFGEIHDANDKAQRTRGDMRDIDRSSS